MPATTTIYYSIKGVTDITKLALEYKKIQSITKLSSELERQKCITESILSYTNLIKNDVQSLMHMYFQSAYENLNYALKADAANRLDYLRQARNRFIDATTIEKNENLIVSYIGLALCQELTGDKDNSTATLSKIKNVYCDLPDDYEALVAMDPNHDSWMVFYCSYFMKKLFSRLLYGGSSNDAFDSACGGCDDCTRTYLKRHLKAFQLSGGFSYDEETLKENSKRAIKLILQEDFETFKSNIVSSFAIK